MYANMAAVRVKPQFLSPAKTFFKICLLVAVLIYIFNKVLGGGDDAPSVGSSVDEKIQSFQWSAVPNGDVKAQAGNNTNVKPSGLSESELGRLWNFTEKQRSNDVYVMIPFANVKSNPKLQAKFYTCVSSMSDLSSAQIVLFIVGDRESHDIAEKIVEPGTRKNIQLHFVDVEALGEKMKELINTMQHLFSHKPGAYFSHTLFFLSIAMHRLAPPTLSRLIMLDADLKFKADIKHLHDFFDRFSDTNVMGLAHEMQPVYRHILSLYRQSHPGTRAGGPPPDGLPGFNSGVLLIDLDKMRRSQRYNSLLDSDVVKKLAEKYSYKGHLGDQDFYSLISLDLEDLFYVLPCTWNRQLCQWWRDKGYDDVFEKYFACDGEINIYHGSCNTPFPKDA